MRLVAGRRFPSTELAGSGCLQPQVTAGPTQPICSARARPWRSANSAAQNVRDPILTCGLMLEVRDDNAAAFEELMLRYQNRLVTVLEHLVGNRATRPRTWRRTYSLRVYRARKTLSCRARSFRPGCSRSPTTWPSNALRSRSRRREVQCRKPTASGRWQATRLDEMAQAASGLMPARQLDKAEMRDIVQRGHRMR